MSEDVKLKEPPLAKKIGATVVAALLTLCGLFFFFGVPLALITGSSDDSPVIDLAGMFLFGFMPLAAAGGVVYWGWRSQVEEPQSGPAAAKRRRSGWLAFAAVMAGAVLVFFGLIIAFGFLIEVDKGEVEGSWTYNLVMLFILAIIPVAGGGGLIFTGWWIDQSSRPRLHRSAKRRPSAAEIILAFSAGALLLLFSLIMAIVFAVQTAQGVLTHSWSVNIIQLFFTVLLPVPTSGGLIYLGLIKNKARQQLAPPSSKPAEPTEPITEPALAAPAAEPIAADDTAGAIAAEAPTPTAPAAAPLAAPAPPAVQTAAIKSPPQINHPGLSSSRIAWQFIAGAAINSSACEADGVIYVGSDDGHLYALDAASGQQLWRFRTGGEIEGEPCVVDNLVIFGSNDCHLYLVNRHTGSAEGHFRAEGPLAGRPALQNNFVFVACQAGNVYKFDLRSREEVWRLSTKRAVFGSPVVNNDMLFVGGANKRLLALDSASGSALWHFQTGNVIETTPAYHEGHLFFGGHDRKLHCLNAGDGRQIWSTQVANIILSSPTIAEESVYFGCNDGCLYCLSAISGLERWRFATGAEVRSTPVVADGVVYFGSDDGHLYAVDAKTGSRVWSLPTGDWITAKPLASGGRIYAGNHDGTFSAVNAVAAANTVAAPRHVAAEPPHPDPWARPGSDRPVASFYSNYQSLWRLFLLLTFVSSFYQIFWFHKNWKQIALHKNLRIRTGWKTLGLFVPFLNMYLAYDQFVLIKSCLSEAKARTFPLLAVTTAFLSLTYLPITLPGVLLATTWLPSDALFMLLLVATAFVSVIGSNLVLVFIQERLNRYWRQEQAGWPERRRFSAGEIVVLIFFVPLTLLGHAFNFLTILPADYETQQAGYESQQASRVAATKTIADGDWVTYLHPRGETYAVSLPASWKNLEPANAAIDGNRERPDGVPSLVFESAQDPEQWDATLLWAVEPFQMDYIELMIKVMELKPGSSFENLIDGDLAYFANNADFSSESISHQSIAYPIGQGEVVRAKFKSDAIQPTWFEIYSLHQGDTIFVFEFYVPDNKTEEAKPIIERILQSFRETSALE